MKKKPMNFTQADVDKFRNVNHEVPETAQAESKNEPIPISSGLDQRITKTVRMRYRFSVMLKDEAHRQSKKTGTKVSEADLLDEALANWQITHQTTPD